jgi:hypothetical protein
MKKGNLSRQTQEMIVYQYLLQTSATNQMVSLATGVPQRNICRIKRKLEKVGRLWEVEYKPCEVTKHKAWYLTTNPDLSPNKNQLGLFD